MSIATRFKQIRKHFGLSQAQFAQRIKKSPGFISNVETDRSEVSMSTIQEVCRVFGIDKNWLSSGTGDMFTDGNRIGKADKDNVGVRIKLIRRKSGMTQEQFADMIGYSKMQIHYVENGKTIPSNELIRSASTAFNVSYEWLLTGEGEMKAEDAVVDNDLIEWLKRNPDIVRELRRRSGLD